MEGTVTGSINDNGNIHLTTSWGGDYKGGVGSDAFIGGTTSSAGQKNVVTWRGNRAATCRPEKPVRTLGKKKPAPAGPKGGAVANKPGIEILAAPAAPKNMATVTGDVDIYDVPGGGGTVIGVLAAGRKVAAVCQADQWCKVTDALPGRTGWVWGEFLAF